MKSEPIRILLIEDNPGDARLIREMLTEVRNISSDCECADRLSIGLERLAEGAIDVILLDLSLPDSQGLNTLERVHAAAPGVPIVVMTGLDDEVLGVNAVKDGAQDYLVKGQVDGSLLMQAIRYAVERQRVQMALRESEERYALAVGAANDGLWDWKFEADTIYLSPRWKFMLGYGEHEIGNDPEEWFSRVHPEELEEVKADIACHLEGGIPHFESEHRMQHKDGTYRWMLSRGLAVRDADGSAYRMAGSQTEITDRKMAEEKLSHEASHDALTGLPNRSRFMDLLSHSIEHAAQRENYLLAVLFLDLDRFKVINDSLGHQIGDQLLIGISRSVENTLRPNDTVARLGGDEFAILLDNIRDASDAIRVADRIQKQLSIPFNLSGHKVFTTASIGIALSTIGYDLPNEYLRDADTAMYRAKTRGKARHEIFDTEMHTEAVARLRLEEDLRRALDHQEFQIHYQPILSLASGKMTGVEAFVRWQHPRRGLVFPSEFILLAEETGLIQAIDEWVLRTACAQNRAWNDAFNSQLQLAVNFSLYQFQDPNLLELILGVLKETGMPADALELDITESTAMRDINATTATLKELNAMGIQISIDDFGTGYSSLGSLKRFPIKTLKIDESFVRDMTSDSDDAAITAAIIAMAHQLKMQVIAEGVETEEQLAFLRSQRCDKIQGYLFSQPMPAEEFTKQLQEGRIKL